MKDYTGMLERLGDLAAHQIVQTHNALVREQTAAHGGHEVELRGDGRTSKGYRLYGPAALDDLAFVPARGE